MRIYFLFIGLLANAIAFAQFDCYENKQWPMPKLSEAAEKTHSIKLLEARQEYEKDSLNADAIIWLGRREAYLGNYKKAIDVFSRGISLHPNDARFYRHRGHRYLTLRCFDKGIEDFEKAAELIQSKADEIEPDGIPNEKNIPVSTLKTNTYYHLGLSYFLTGQYEKAEKAYYKGIVASKNDDMMVAMVNWLYITLLTQGKTEEAANFFAIVPRTPKLIENTDYLSLLYYYVHNPADNEIERYTNTLLSRTATGKDSMSVGAATLYFGAGYYAQLKGMPQKARLFFEKAIATKQWSSFGYIAAEAALQKQKDEN